MLDSIYCFWGLFLPSSGVRPKLIERAGAREMSPRPSNDCRKQIAKISALVCQFIGITHGALLVRRSGYNSGLLKPLQSVGQNIRWYSLGRIKQLAVRHAATKEIPRDQQRPFIADDLQQIGDGTRRARKTQPVAALFYGTPSWLVSTVFCHLHIAS